jgi:hypothetical protein
VHAAAPHASEARSRVSGSDADAGSRPDAASQHAQQTSTAAAFAFRATLPGDTSEVQADRFARTGAWSTPARPGAGSIAGGHGVRRAIERPGEPLEPELRGQFEDDLGVGLGAVRLHTDAAASASARSLHAQAYTVGTDVVFASGRLQPGSAGGRELLAHELAHVAQQTASGTPVLAASPDEGFWDVVSVVSPVAGMLGTASGVSGGDVLEATGRYVLGDTLWDVLQAFMGGFMEGLAFHPRELQQISDRVDDFGVEDALDFVGGFTEGVLEGLWDEFVDLLKALWALIGLPAALNRFLTQTLPELALPFAARIGPMIDGPGGLSARLDQLRDAFNADPAGFAAQAQRLLDVAHQQVLAGIRGRGRDAASAVVDWLLKPWDQIAEDIGKVTGRILFEVLLFVGTDAIGSFLKEVGVVAGRLAAPVVEGALDAFRAVAELFGTMLDWLEGLVRGVAAEAGALFDALRDLVAGLRNVVSEMAAPELATADAGGMRMSMAEPRGGMLETGALEPTRTTRTTVAQLYGRAEAPTLEELGARIEALEGTGAPADLVEQLDAIDPMSPDAAEQIRALDERVRLWESEAPGPAPEGIGALTEEAEAARRATLNEQAERLEANRLQGTAGEEAVMGDILAQRPIPELGSPATLRGSQVRVQTRAGLRIIDHVVQLPSGELVALEVKTGGATRSGYQIICDDLLEAEGGTVIGSGAPGFSGQVLRVRTVVLYR